MLTCRKLDDKTLDIVTAAEVIAVNQDPLGIPGDRVWKVGPAEVRPTTFAGSANATHPQEVCE